MLQRFLTGTEKSKPYCERISKHEIDTKPGPFRDMTFESPAKRAMKIKHMNDRNDERKSKNPKPYMAFLSSMNHRDESTSTTPDYVGTIALMNAADIAGLIKSAPVGWRLLGFRAKRAGAGAMMSTIQWSV